MVHLRSTLPGWYPERATHVHVAVHIGGKVVEGKYIGKGASVKHIGQFYFSEDILKRVDKLKPYSKNTVVRMRNANDQFFNEDSKGGYNPVASKLF